MAADDLELRGAVLVGAVPDMPRRVFEQAAKQAKLLGVSLVVAFVDVTRFVTYEDPDGTPHAAPIDVNTALSSTTVAAVRHAAEESLAEAGVRWEFRNPVGDPALALRDLADELDAPLIVVGTRRRGFGETLREFFTGSVAARLAHRQHRPLLVVPLQEPVPDSEPWLA